MVLKQAGDLQERVAFDAPTEVPNGYGGITTEWVEAFRCHAGFKYERGREEVIGGGLTGTASFKVFIRASDAARGITTEHRMRDVRRGVTFQVREVDQYTDRAFIWLAVESGVAT